MFIIKTAVVACIVKSERLFSLRLIEDKNIAHLITVRVDPSLIPEALVS